MYILELNKTIPFNMRYPSTVKKIPPMASVGKGKRCLPGTGFCLSNMTWFLYGLLALAVIYLWIRVSDLGKQTMCSSSSVQPGILKSIATTSPMAPSSLAIPIQDIRGDVGRCGIGGRTVGDPLTNPYVPPIRCDAGSLTPNVMMVGQGGVPINIPTQGYSTEYAQVGILTRQSNIGNNDILPLMGRRTPTARDKWQYYTVAGGGAGGNLQTKLPVRVKGRSCSGEYGCDEIYNRDNVFVEGYQDEFVATIYESGLFSYLPL